ncbi:type I polyketide synthase [Legionella cardiaca]|uniref:Beta-ketoacyl synthase N-terminal-like domain-containing protein n=1 Tax=Legionella cardiaca TaxID=1071983 RepID=A0ABY8AU97_9GAMM|nr:type I polyketide synthase [Legionella cardiaca]WED44267.1 beta-ketoacyl synthase N-terminal-like domain-containing protein [Legionella cardiaca]
MTTSIIDVLLERSLNEPDKIAYRFVEYNQVATLSYGGLIAKVLTVANHLRQYAKQGDRVLLVFPPGLDYIVAFYACLLSNTVAVPVYPPSTKELIEKLQHIISDSRPTLVLSSSDIVNKIKQLKWLKTLRNFPLIERLANRYIENNNVIDINWDFDTFHWLSTDNLTPERNLSIDESKLPVGSDLAFLQYTSGSTGDPKGVMVTHGNIMSNQLQIKNGFGLRKDDIIANWLPPYHDMGLIGAIMQPLYLGAEAVLMSPFQYVKKPVNWLKMISEHDATVSGGPNFAYALCVKKIKEEELEGIDLSRWRNAFCGAEPINHKVLDSFASRFASIGFNKKALFPCYGLAEATLMVSCGYYQETDTKVNGSYEKRVDCGDVYQNVTIVDPDNLCEKKEGEIGEIWINGSSVAHGYWNKPTLTQAVFSAQISGKKESFFRTGDLGYLWNNHLYPIGRIKDLIIINGRNYFSSDIEETIAGVSDNIRKGGYAAFSIIKEGTEQLIIVAEISSNLLVDEQKKIIKKIYENVIASWHIESYDIVLTTTKCITKTTSGKLQRFKVKQKYLESNLKITLSLRQLHADEMTLSPEEIESQEVAQQLNDAVVERLKNCVIQVLGDSSIVDIERPLSEFGLTSIKAVELTGILEQEFSQAIEPAILYNYPTIYQLAQYLSNPSQLAINPSEAPQKQSVSTDIAVIGMSCRFPGNINTPEEFWSFLVNKGDGIGSVPGERWKAEEFYSENYDEPGKIGSKSGGFLTGIEQFDETFFNITANEARYIDPQQRLTLQAVWHAFENAGIAPESLRKQDVGVFIGASNNDYAHLLLKQGNETISPYLGSGNALSAIAGRVAYLFGFHGPCMTIDTACSSSLAAVHQAVNAIRQGDCTLAIAGGVNLILTPQLSIALTKAHMLSPEGHCKPFSEDADGYVRSEGLGFVILKPLSIAIKDKDSILAVIKGSSINQDGTSNGLTAPNGLAQQALIKKCLLNAGVGPEEIGFIECHGTGTKLGDPIEIAALSAIFSSKRTAHNPLIVGAVKSNIGHLESAAGIAGFIKTVLILKHKIIPPNLHFRTINPHIDSTRFPLIFPTENLRWENNKGLRYAGVSSFGFTGTNVHVTLAEYEQRPAETTGLKLPQSLLVISAKDKETLLSLKSTYVELLKNSTTDLQTLCINTALKRQHLNYRIAIYAAEKEEMINKLQHSTPELTPSINTGKIAFLFTGQGAQYLQMGKQLYATSQQFRKVLNKCDILVKKQIGFSVIEQLVKENQELLNDTKYVQPILFSVEYALAKMWEYWGIIPAYVTGHSLGIYAAACFSGILDLEEAIELVCMRAKLMEKTSSTGVMLALSATLSSVNQLILMNALEKVDVAAINTSTQIVVSGELEQIERLTELAKQEKISTKMLPSTRAFHSQCMDSILDEFYESANKITYRVGHIPLVEDLTGNIVKTFDATYLRDQIRKPVNFVAVADTLKHNGCNIYLEIGPQPVLCGFIGYSDDRTTKLLPSLRKNQDDWLQISQALQTLYLANCRIDWKRVYDSFNTPELPLPYYPFLPNKHWLDDQVIKQKKQSKNKGNTARIASAANNAEERLTQESIVWFDLPISERNKHLQQIIEKEIRYVSGLDKNKPIGTDDNFFEMGIDSLVIVQLINNLNHLLKQANILIKPEKITKPCINSVIAVVNDLIDEQHRTLNS